ncbi:MAG TPA: hypothetical protein VIL30_07085 [Ramlibacter sp.]|jgi:hypothetical protein
MASDSIPFNWPGVPPAAYDIVACYFPETEPLPDGSDKLRPALVLNVFKDKNGGGHFCEVAYGTTTLKFPQRAGLDLIVQHAAHLKDVGLHRATRFNLDPESAVILPWTPEFFGCWGGMDSPYMGSLTEDYLKELAWLFFRRSSQ